MTAPLAPRFVRPAGLPLARVALGAGALVLIGGALIAVLWRSAPPLTAQPHVAADGKDVLHLVCDEKSCKSGTIVSFDGSSATFTAGKADLPLVTPLRVGDNALALSIDRPGMGRDETVNLVVPVAYRIRADVGTMQGPRPTITIRVQAVPEAVVRIDGRPIALDATGSAAYPLDETAATEGAADESRVVAVDVPYVVSLKGRPPETGVVSARVAIAPLRVDAPGTTAVVTESQVLLAGRAARGARVTIDGSAVVVGPEGAFETRVALDTVGQRTFEVQGGTTALVARTVHVVISRVANLADAALAFEDLGPIGYDAAASTLTNKIGLPIAVEGAVVELRRSGHRTVVLVDDRRGCAKGPCLARVVIGRELVADRGDSLRAYGHVARAFTTAAGQAVPEIEAEFVLDAKR